MSTPKLELVRPTNPVSATPSEDDAIVRPRLRSRLDGDNDFIMQVTKSQLVPTLEQAWQFKWDKGHSRKFMLDVLTVGRTLVATLPVNVETDPTLEHRHPSGAPDGIIEDSSEIDMDEKPAAYVWYVLQPRQWRPLPRRIFWVNYLVVAPEFQGLGLGSHIMNHCTEEARKAGCTSIELWVQAINDSARHFYEKLQFTPLRTTNGNVHMRKRLR